MKRSTLLGTILLSLLPISELRGAIPFAFFRGVPLLSSVCLATLVNLFVAPLAFIFLDFFHSFFYQNWPFYSKIFDHTVQKAQQRVGAKVKAWGYFGLLLFVGIPLPFTGAYSGVLGAWILGLDRKKSLLAITCGVLVAAIIVTILLALGYTGASLFIKVI